MRLSTLASGNSVLGVNWGHVLGDAAAFSRFLEDVSLFYNMSFADLGDEMPTFEPHVSIPKATDKILKDYHLDILAPIPVQDVIKGYTDSTIASKPVTVTLTRNDIAHITATRSPGENFSDGDMVSGWWISVLERAGIQVNKVVQTINVGTRDSLTTVPQLPCRQQGVPSEPAHAGCERRADAGDPAPSSQTGPKVRAACA